jgi:putative hydrolase of the HAD superfamily
MIAWIAFDADDTLWHSERFYHEAQQRFTGLLAPYGFETTTALARLHDIEMSNLPTFGYGIKGFILSMIDAAVDLTGGQVRGEDIRALVNLGRWMAANEIILLDHVRETVEQLSARYPLMLVTKGDLMDQERKISLSGLAPYFKYIEIVSDKTREVYAALLAKYRVEPDNFLMVGNSLRSDILPVLELGCTAVYVPYEITWVHEGNVTLPETPGRFYQIGDLGELPALLNELTTREKPIP